MELQSLKHLPNSSFSDLNYDYFNKSFLFIYQKELIGHYVMGISTLTISCVGLIGNLLSIGVLLSKSMRGTTTNTYLIALALSDSLMLTFAILVAIRDARVPQLGKASWELWEDVKFVPKSYPFCHACAILFQVCSNWLTVAFTIDRYIMICHPFEAKSICTIARSKFITSCVSIASIVYNIPRFFEYEYFEINFPRQMPDNEIIFKISWYTLSSLGQSNTFRNGYHLWSWCVLVISLPSVIIGVLNVFLVCEIKKSIMKMKLNQNLKIKKYETDVMLIGVIIIFLTCQIPSAISHVFWGTTKHSDKMSSTWLILNEIGNLLIILNAAVNIIPYYMFSKKFRIIFVHTYIPCYVYHKKQHYTEQYLNNSKKVYKDVPFRMGPVTQVTANPIGYNNYSNFNTLKKSASYV